MARPSKYTPEEIAERRRESCRKWRKNNPNKQKAAVDNWDANNKDKRRAHRNKWAKNNPDKLKAIAKVYYIDNKDQIREQHKQYENNRRQTDPVYALNCNIRSLLGTSFKRKGFTKRSKTADILGCSWEQFKQYIESQFEPWMTWDNRGGKVVLEPNTNWDLDHIIPVSSAATEEDIIRLNHYTNFQPLCSYQNRFVKRNIL